MANANGKKARKALGNRFDAKASKAKKRKNKVFGSLPVSALKGNTGSVKGAYTKMFQNDTGEFGSQ